MAINDFDDGADKTAILKVVDVASKPPPADPAPYLVVIQGKQVGRQVKVVGPAMFIGRADDCAMHIEDDGVSRRHAKVVLEGGQPVLLDNGSTNGTFANGVKVDRHELQDGDKIRVGSTTILKFTVQDSLEESAQRALYDSATRDGLTGAYNKKFFAERLKTEFAFARRRAAPLSLLMFDIDHFKKINDTFGHIAGDVVLKELAAVVTRELRTEDVFARYGGEEFGVIMRDTASTAAMATAERLRATVQRTRFAHDGRIIPVTISVGAAMLDKTLHGEPKDLLAAADALLYKAKHGGRNRVEGPARGR